jgi:hypothetical protein
MKCRLGLLLLKGDRVLREVMASAKPINLQFAAVKVTNYEMARRLIRIPD